MQTRDQKRAQDAYRVVQGVVTSPCKDKFRTMARKFPAMVLQCGVLQTLAFCKAEDDESKVYGEVNNWLSSADSGLGIEGKDTLESVMSLDLSKYRRVAREAIIYGTWLKRATETILGKE